MKNLILLLCFMITASAFAQEKPADAKKKPAAEKSPTIAEVLDRNLSNLERDFTSAADAMPEDKWDFAPTNGEFKGVRTFREQVRHVAATNFVEAAGLLHHLGVDHLAMVIIRGVTVEDALAGNQIHLRARGCSEDSVQGALAPGAGRILGHTEPAVVARVVAHVDHIARP